jgi:L-ascorbate metabolism protein UlaG (beta-lactamase superfamily)
LERPFRKLLSLATGAYATGRALTGGPGHRGPVSDHFDGSVFRNENPAATAGKTFADFLRWQRTGHREAWPTHVEHAIATEFPSRVAPAECAVTFVNHITFLLQYRGLNVLTDPVWSERVSPVQWAGPKRVHEPGIAFERLPRIDLVLVSHDHYDHLDLATLERLQRTHRPVFVTGLGNGPFLQRHGITRVHELDWWQTHTAGDWRCTFVPAQHWSGRSLQGRNRTLWGGFVLEVAGLRTYFAGDTGYCDHFTQVRERCGVPDLALLPIGAYEPRWFMRDQHMDPAEAVRAHLDLHARQSIATHYGCFQLTDEAIDAPVRELQESLARERIAAGRFLAMRPGTTFHLTASAGRHHHAASA